MFDGCLMGQRTVKSNYLRTKIQDKVYKKRRAQENTSAHCVRILEKQEMK